MPSAASRIGYLVANALRQQAGYDRLSHSEWDEMHRANRDGCTVPSEVRTGIAIGEEASRLARAGYVRELKISQFMPQGEAGREIMGRLEAATAAIGTSSDA